MTKPLDKNLVVEAGPSPDDIRFLEDGIYEFNVQVTGISDGKLFGVFLRDASGVAVDGAHGWTWAKTCYIRFLFVSADLRKQGYGIRLMRVVEAEARGRGCEQILLETLDFQAPRFYLKLCFEIIGRVPNYVRGHESFTMVKCLT